MMETHPVSTVSKTSRQSSEQTPLADVDLVSLKGPCGTWDVARPSSMSFGQTYDPSSGSFGIRPIGRWLTRFANSKRHVYNSKGVNICSPTAFFRATLQLFTNASAHPFWCGDAAVVNLHCTPFSAENSRSLSVSHPLIISFNSRSAPTNWVPLSLIMTLGCLLTEKNLRSTWMNSMVEQSTASSRWTTLVFKQVNITP